MAIFNTREYTGTTSTSKNHPLTCHTCKQKKTGVFGTDPYGNPRCFDCMPDEDKMVYTQDELDERSS